MAVDGIPVERRFMRKELGNFSNMKLERMARELITRASASVDPKLKEELTKTANRFITEIVVRQSAI
jgi:hypothetical protein